MYIDTILAFTYKRYFLLIWYEIKASHYGAHYCFLWQVHQICKRCGLKMVCMVSVEIFWLWCLIYKFDHHKCTFKLYDVIYNLNTFIRIIHSELKFRYNEHSIRVGIFTCTFLKIYYLLFAPATLKIQIIISLFFYHSV